MFDGNSFGTRARETWLLPCLLAAVCMGCGRAASAPVRSPPVSDASVPTRADVERGVALYHDGSFSEAAIVLERASEARAEDPRAWSYLGLARVKLVQIEPARTALSRALALDSSYAEAHFGMGLAAVYDRDLVEATRELERAVVSKPDHAYAHYHLGLVYNERRKIDRALLHLERFLALAPDAPEAPRVRQLLARLR